MLSVTPSSKNTELYIGLKTIQFDVEVFFSHKREQMLSKKSQLVTSILTIVVQQVIKYMFEMTYSFAVIQFIELHFYVIKTLSLIRCASLRRQRISPIMDMIKTRTKKYICGESYIYIYIYIYYCMNSFGLDLL